MRKKLKKSINDVLFRVVSTTPSLIASGVGINATLTYASQGEYVKSVICATCSMLCGFGAGYQYKKVEEE